MKTWLFLAATLFLNASASAQTMRDAILPAPGSPAIVPVGDVVYEKSHLLVLPAYTVSEDFSGKNMFATVVISAGDRFMMIPSKVIMKACRSASIEDFQRRTYNACLFDDDGDGRFDRYGANEVQSGKKLPHPISYKLTEFVQPASDSIKQTVTYLGSTKDVLRLSYREFVNDMARPAFTEEYTFPLISTFPQTFAFKGVKLRVSAIDGEGLHYVIEQSASK
jgi:hypothetical protein